MISSFRTPNRTATLSNTAPEEPISSIVAVCCAGDSGDQSGGVVRVAWAPVQKRPRSGQSTWAWQGQR